MVKTKWGAKRACLGCGERFYDLNHNPATCPKCGLEFNPAATQKSSRSRGTAPVEVAEKAPPASAEVETVANKVDGEADEKTTSDDKSDDEELIEDVSELGEDEDDMFEVMDNVKDAKEDPA